VARTAQEQREANAAKMRAYRARKKAEQTSSSSMGTTGGVPAGDPGTTPPVGGGDVPDLQIEVKVDPGTPQPKLSLLDRVLGKGSKPQSQPGPRPAPSKSKASSKKSDNLLVSVLPTLAASLIATYAQQMLPDPYKPCAPSKQEVTAIIGPLMSIIGRRVEVAAKVSQDAIDLTNALISAMAFGTRAYIMYVQIKNDHGDPHASQKRTDAYLEKLDREAREYDAVIADDVAALRAYDERKESEPAPSLAQGLRAYQSTSAGTGAAPAGVNGNRPASQQPGPASDGPGSTASDRELRDYEAGLVANMFARDRTGRVRLGLLAE
jgi:hypothetical protein